YITLDNPCLIGISFLPAFLLPSLPLFLPSLPLFLRSLPPSLPNAIEIYSLHIDCKVTSRYAHTVITSRIVNRANESKEALFDVELPKKAFITNFSMTIDGKEYPGIIKEKKAAQAQYDSAISRGQSAGIVKSAGRKLEKFSVSINVAAGGKVNFELNYEQLLDRKLGKYELIIKVKPKQLVEDFQIDAHIFEPQGISFLETESSFLNNEIGNALKKTQEETKAHISFKPTLSQQRKNPDSEETLLDGDFLIRYDVKRNVAIMNGYFVHYFAPSEMPVFPKNIIFVIDKSGSMSGNKIRQTKEALLKILEDIKEEDYINFVLFGSKVHKWKDTLIKATPENLAEARRYVQRISIAGWTNLNGGLMAGIELLNEAHKTGSLPERSASLIIMLTDGRPSKGELNTDRISQNVRNAVQGKYPLYNLGFGYDLDYGSLEKMASENNGLARRIHEDSDSALQLQGFYDEVANPLLTEVELHYPENAISDLTQNNFKHYYDGSEIVVSGRIIDDVLNSITADVKAHGLEVTPEKIILHNGTKQMTFTWLDEVTLLHPTLTLKIIRKKSLEVSMGEGATFVIILHQTWRRNPKHGDFLGFYALDSHRLSEHTHGLLGQFFHPINFTILEVHPGSTPEKPDATMIVKNHQLTVTRGWQKDYTENSKHGTNVPCWFIHNNAEGLIDSTYTDYVVSSLF
uniref:Inter-alpha-trypsin inhibitor heavy chain H3 n=1 Tax=Naja naja TaxID=35670 RepID=A0A8C6V7I0_NAJNA